MVIPSLNWVLVSSCGYRCTMLSEAVATVDGTGVIGPECAGRALPDGILDSA